MKGNWALALQGLGAGLQGQGPQWAQQQYQQQEREKLIQMEEQRRNSMLQQERAKNAALGFRSVGQLLEKNETMRAETVLGEMYLSAQGTTMAQPALQLYRMIQSGQTDQAKQLISAMDQELTTRLGLPAPPKPEQFTLGPEETRYTDDGNVVARGQPKPTDYNQAFLPDGSPNTAYQNYQRQLREAGRNTTTVNVGDRNYVGARSTAQAEQMTQLERAARSAHQSNEDLQRFLDASAGGDQGAFAPAIGLVRNMLSSFGYEAEQLTDNAVMQQAINEILQNKMAELGARGLTDSDMMVLQRALPQFETSKQAREEIVNVLQKANINTIREYMEARDWEAQEYPDMPVRTPSWLKYYDVNNPTYTESWGQ